MNLLDSSPGRVAVAAVLIALACGDDGTSADASGSATGSTSGSTGASSEASGTSQTSTTPTSTTVATGSSAGETSLSGSESGVTDDACAMIDGLTYVSIEEMGCGLGPNGVELCPWTISFDAGVFEWFYSDVAEGGNYTCEGATISSMGAYGYSGMLDYETGVLTWQGADYVAR